VVVDEKGTFGKPIPLTVKTGHLRTWFDAHFRWQKNAAGRWDIAERVFPDTPASAKERLL
jgi:hypothetical protein